MAGDKENALNIREHDSVSDGKKVMLFGWTGTAAVRVKVASDGTVQTAGGSTATEIVALQASQSSLLMTAYQGGAWTVIVSSLPSFSISSVAVTGGSLSAYQGGVWNVGANGGSLMAFMGGTWNVGANGGSLLAFQGGTWNVGANGGSLSATILSQPARVFTTDSIASTQEVGRLSASLTAVAPSFAVINVAGAGDNCIVAATSSKQIVVLQYSLVVGANGDGITWKQGATAVTGQMRFAANGGIAEPYTSVGLFKTASGASLYLNSSLGSQISGHITYVVV